MAAAGGLLRAPVVSVARLNPRQAVITAQVSIPAGVGSHGMVWADPVEVKVVYVGRREATFTGDGVEVVSSSHILAAPEHQAPGVDVEAVLVEQALVTVRGVPAQIVKSAAAISRGRLIYVTAWLA